MVISLQRLRSRLTHWIRDKFIFTCPCTDGTRFVLHLIPHYGLRGTDRGNPSIYQKCIMWDYYYWAPHDPDLMGWSQDGIWSIGIPFTKHNIVRDAYGKPKR